MYILTNRWTWKTPNVVTKIEIDYILTNRQDIVTDVTVINLVNTESNHIMVMSSITQRWRGVC